MPFYVDTTGSLPDQPTAVVTSTQGQSTTGVPSVVSTGTIDVRGVTLEDIDRAIRDWFDRTVDARVKAPNSDVHKVPVIFSSGERWSTGRTKQTFRDENGVLILPIISIRRVSVEPDPTKMALGIQVNNIQISKRVDPQSSANANLQNTLVEGGTVHHDKQRLPAVYDVYTMPYPDRMVAMYQLVIQAQFISQMNDILQKIWHSLDIQKSFVAPFENDGRAPPRSYQYGAGSGGYQTVPALNSRYVVGFFESTSTDNGNLEEMTDSERIIKYGTELTVPFVLFTAPEGMTSAVKVERTSVKLSLFDENVKLVEDPADLDKIFGKIK